jgi:hypothetical protein
MNQPKTISLALLLAGLVASPAAVAHGVPAEQIAALTAGGAYAYLLSGMTHMVTGYDHLLFLFGVMFFLSRFVDIVKFITVFTIGHCITLLGATLLAVRADYYLVDAFIATSVIYIGFSNLDGFRRGLGIRAPNLLWMVFGFGLIHGFGLATRLLQLPLPETGMVSRILAFNVGVELGQVAALVVMAALLAMLRRRPAFAPFTIAANYGLIVAGALLCLMQLHSYSHHEAPDEFGWPADLHAHDHEAQRAQDARDSLMPDFTPTPPPETKP